jgi:hypothetical protein
MSPPFVEPILSSTPQSKSHADQASRSAAAAGRCGVRAWFSQHRAAQVLGYRDFRLLWFGHVFASMSFWMDQVTRRWLMYELTDSTVQLGLLRGIQALPILFLAPIAGSVADRYSRKRQILITQIADA